MTSQRALLGGLIDHAPTFPPARLSSEEALAEDRRVRANDEAWIVGRLVWRASCAGDLDGYGAPLSLVLDGPFPNGRAAEAVEARWPEVPRFGGEVFVELLPDGALEGNLASLRASGALAKVRCGGETTPSPVELARFVRACAEAGVAFKASAGLHHPLRSGEMHGFLNLLAAALWPVDAERALCDEDASAFSLSHSGFLWRDNEAGVLEIDRMRRRFRSFGSCSVAEPVADLRTLGFL